MNNKPTEWNGPTVDPNNLKPGDDVIYHGADTAQVRWGECADPREHGLRLRTRYKVALVEIHEWHTKIYLDRKAGLGFPSAAFHHPGQRQFRRKKASKV